MALSVTHNFVSAVADGGNANLVQPSNWNDTHAMSGTLPVANGGTALASGTDGGILGYTASGTLASSVLLTAHALILGGGAGATPTPMASLGTTTTVLHGNAAGAPTFSAVSLTADVSGILPVANGGTGSSSLASTDTQVLFNDGGALAGNAGLTFDKTNKALTLGGATVTTSNPILNLSQTWNAGGVAFTGIFLNITRTAAASGSKLLDLQIGSASTFTVNGGGDITNWGGSGGYSFTSGGNYMIAATPQGNVWQAHLGDAFYVYCPKFKLGSNSDVILSFPTTATLQMGAADAAAPVAQTLLAQSVVAGTTNTAGVDWTLIGSKSTGTGAGGDIVFKTAPAGSTGTTQNAAAEVLRILNTGNVKFTNAANFTANGTVATSITSVGPTGANTTVQEWLTIKNASGTTRYIPCF